MAKRPGPGKFVGGVYLTPRLRYEASMFNAMRRAFLALFLVPLLYAAAHAGSADTSDLVIVTASGRHAFRVELAATDSQRERGLMFRRELKPDAGMLFDMGPREQQATFWMKNTFIPLDMLFIRANGVIQNIAERAVPESLATVPSDGPVKAVLELNGGTAARLGIKPGDKVLHRLFGNAE